MNEIYTKLRQNLPSICEVEINRKNINPSCSKPEIVPYLCLLINCVNVSFIHFHHVHYLFLVYVRHFLNQTVIFLALLAPLLAHRPRQPPSWSNGSAGTDSLQGSRGGFIGERSLPLKLTKVTLFTMIFYNSENSIRDIRPFYHPLFCHSSVMKYISSLL